MSSDDPVKSAAAGVTEGALNWTAEQIKKYAAKIRDKELIFIQDRETIEVVREERKSVEWGSYAQYVNDPDLRLLIQMGLTLRRLESNQPRLHALREKIVSKYGQRGLHIAEFVQNKNLGIILGLFVPQVHSHTEITAEIEDLLNKVGKYIVFVKSTDNFLTKSKELETRIHANLPNILILCSGGSACTVADKIARQLEPRLSEYEVTRHVEPKKLMIVFKRYT